jgi:hypothetical protein
MVELGKIANVPTPLMQSILNLSEALLGVDFKINGRTLQNIFYGIEDMNSIKEKLQL